MKWSGQCAEICQWGKSCGEESRACLVLLKLESLQNGRETRFQELLVDVGFQSVSLYLNNHSGLEILHIVALNRSNLVV